MLYFVKKRKSQVKNHDSFHDSFQSVHHLFKKNNQYIPSTLNSVNEQRGCEDQSIVIWNSYGFQELYSVKQLQQNIIKVANCSTLSSHRKIRSQDVAQVF